MSEVSKPKSDTLSQERTYHFEWLDEALECWKREAISTDEKIEGMNVVEQIKVRLQPVPEKKLNEFAAHWWRILKDYQSGKMAGQLTNLIKAMLEEYDTLKESSDEKIS